MTFEDLNLNKPLSDAIESLGFVTPTTIQFRTYPVVMSGRDVCGIAQTGTGKTFAFLLPLLRLWKFSKLKEPQILILVPTRELVTQIIDAINSLTPQMSVVAKGIYGGVNINTQWKDLQDGSDIIVATPGRIYDLAVNGAFKTRSVRKLVIDEMDEMLNLGFRTQIKNIVELLPSKRQNLLFSATITPDVKKFMETYFNDPEMIEAAPTGTPVENIEQSFYSVPNFFTKVNLLKMLLADVTTYSKVLVFTASKKSADLLFEQMESEFPGSVGVIHSNKEQNHRFSTVAKFKNGEHRFIIATDVVARGIDVAEVTHVINFDLPAVPEHYIHRIGRTGRADKKGIAISFITENEMKFQKGIEALMNKSIPVAEIPEGLIISKQLTEDEQPKVFMKTIELKLPKKEERGASFHEKSAKNSKVNFIVRKKDRMQKKYGKPIKRPPKK